MFTDKQVEDLVNLLVTVGPSTKIYLGCDSVRYIKSNIKMSRFATVCIVHINGNNGCRIFSNISHELDYDAKPGRPKMRMMNEVMKVCELYTQLLPFIDGFEVEIHLDIATNPMHGSNCAANEAAGYVLGMTGVEPKLKPESFASSFGADHVVNKGAA